MVDRTRSSSATSVNRAAVRESARLLSEGRVLIVFPEGYPAVDPHGSRKELGEIMPFQPGVEGVWREASRSRGEAIPVIPCGLSYRRRADNHWNVVVNVGAPIKDAAVNATNLRNAVAALID
jgi:putative membrane protein